MGTTVPRHTGMDELLTYISGLDLNEITSIQAHTYNNGYTAALSDEELAMALFAEEAAGLLNITRDHRNGTNLTSEELIEELEEQEELARYDRLVAIAISEDRPIPERPPRRPRRVAPRAPQLPMLSMTASPARFPLHPAEQPTYSPPSAPSSSASTSSRPVDEPRFAVQAARVEVETPPISDDSIEGIIAMARQTPDPQEVTRVLALLNSLYEPNFDHGFEEDDDASIEGDEYERETVEAYEDEVGLAAQEEYAVEGLEERDEGAQSPMEHSGENDVSREESPAFVPIAMPPTLEVGLPQGNIAGSIATVDSPVIDQTPLSEAISAAPSLFHLKLVFGSDKGDLRPPSAVSNASGLSPACHSPVCTLPECVVCGDSARSSYVAPCGHIFGIDCLEDLFRRASVEESLYPPRCCNKAIPVPSVRNRLCSSLMDAFDKKSIEFNTADRVYCHKPKCSEFIGAATSTTRSLVCSRCFAMTCGFCKQRAHPNMRCSDDEELKDIAKNMHELNGWQRCPSCHHLVEKDDGCYHMTCVCKVEFCYLCAVVWKGCSCPRFFVPPE